MAWRPNDQFIDGEFDNTVPGRVTGWMRFAGLDEPVTFDLTGDFHRDIRGARIRMETPEAAKASEMYRGYMSGFTTHQTGTVGDITAGREPCDYVDYGYVEWYSERNGRVVLEFAREQVRVIGTPLPWKGQEPVSRDVQAVNLRRFLTAVGSSLMPAAGQDAEREEGPERER